MKISHYLYNAFLIETADKKIAIDPGALLFHYFRFTTLIPKSEWPSITHIFVTHGDPDHYWHVDRVAKASGAPVICNSTMQRSVGDEALLLGPRDKGLSFTTKLDKVITLDVGAEIKIDDLTVRGLKTTHGPLRLKIGPFTTEFKPGPHERIGWGAIGFSIGIDGKTVVNLGDTLLHTSDWEVIQSPDLLMIPIGGKEIHNTMDELEALKAVEAMQPKLVIPCHYNCPGLFSNRLNPADPELFSKECERLGSECKILGKGESLEI